MTEGKSKTHRRLLLQDGSDVTPVSLVELLQEDQRKRIGEKSQSSLQLRAKRTAFDPFSPEHRWAAFNSIEISSRSSRSHRSGATTDRSDELKSDHREHVSIPLSQVVRSWVPSNTTILSESAILKPFVRHGTVIFQSDAKAVEEATRQEKRVKDLRDKARFYAVNYTETSSQTAPTSHCLAETQTEYAECSTQGTQASPANLHDLMVKKRELESGEGASIEDSLEWDESNESELSAPDKMLPTLACESTAQLQKVAGIEVSRAATILTRLLQYNTYRHSHLQYIAAFQQPATEEKTDSTHSGEQEQIVKLWDFHCDEFEGMSVCAMDWGSVCKDVVVVAYNRRPFVAAVQAPTVHSQDELQKLVPNLTDQYQRQKDEHRAKYWHDDPTGMSSKLVLWCFLDRERPFRVIDCEFPITCIALAPSEETAHLLAVGFATGAVAVYDLRRQVDEPLTATHPLAKNGELGHLYAVKSLQWLPSTETEGNESGHKNILGNTRLLSVAFDGTVRCWEIDRQDSFRGAPLVSVLRVRNQALHPRVRRNREEVGSITNQPALSESAISLGEDGALFLVGARDGVIYKCAQSYTEQAVGSFHAHSDTVNAINVSPFAPDIFASASDDGMLCIWSSALRVEKAIRTAAAASTDRKSRETSDGTVCKALVAEIDEEQSSQMTSSLLHTGAQFALLQLRLFLSESLREQHRDQFVRAVRERRTVETNARIEDLSLTSTSAADVEKRMSSHLLASSSSPRVHMRSIEIDAAAEIGRSTRQEFQDASSRWVGVNWSPHSATSLISVARHGLVALWDISRSADPVCTVRADHVGGDDKDTITCLQSAPNSSVFVGTSSGHVEVYMVQGSLQHDKDTGRTALLSALVSRQVPESMIQWEDD